MASTFSPILRIELMGVGDQANTWGNTNNINLGTLIEQAIAGTATIDVTSGNVTLTNFNGTTDQARCAALRVTGTPGTSRNIIAPAVSKLYVIANGSNAVVVLKTSTSTGLTVPVGEVYLAYYDPTVGTEDFRLVGRASATANTANTLVLRDGSGNFAAGTITAVGFSGPLTGNVTGNVTGTVTGNVTGNAGSATVLQTARTIGGVSFNGSANINLPGVNTTGNQNTTGSAATLTTARLLNGVSFNGSADITVPTNLGITAGTTAGPIVTSSSGTNATLPTASSTASGVVTTGSQTFAGIKTFTSTIAGNIIGTAANVTGTVAVANGGTGLTTLTANNVMLGNGTSAPTFVAPSTSGNVLTSNGTTWQSAQLNRLTSGTAQASTSGTAVDFTGIPSWVKRITVMFQGVSLSGSSQVQIQIGSGSITTSGYSSSASFVTSGVGSINSTTGLIVTGGLAAASTFSGNVILCLITNNTYTHSGTLSLPTSTGTQLCGGVSPNLSGVLDRIRITTVNGTDTFDAGLINIMYE